MFADNNYYHISRLHSTFACLLDNLTSRAHRSHKDPTRLFVMIGILKDRCKSRIKLTCCWATQSFILRRELICVCVVFFFDITFYRDEHVSKNLNIFTVCFATCWAQLHIDEVLNTLQRSRPAIGNHNVDKVCQAKLILVLVIMRVSLQCPISLREFNIIYPSKTTHFLLY